MPIYEFVCTVCGRDFEKLVFASTKVECPDCSSDKVNKKLSVFGMSGVDKPFAGAKSSGCGSCSKGSCSSC